MLTKLATAYVEAFIRVISRRDPDAALFAQLDAIEDIAEENSERLDALARRLGYGPFVAQPAPVVVRREAPVWR